MQLAASRLGSDAAGAYSHGGDILQVFYRAHVIGAALFIIFATLHWYGTLPVSVLGLAVYAMDVAYRWFQASYRVDVRVDEAAGTRIVSIVIPLEVGSLNIAAALSLLCRAPLDASLSALHFSICSCCTLSMPIF